MEKLIFISKIGIIIILGNLILSCTNTELLRVAISKNPGATAKAIIKNRPARYRHNPRLLARDIKQLRNNFNKLIGALKKRVANQWGYREARIANRHRYVKYTQNYKSRTIINFDNGQITVETVEQSKSDLYLKNAALTTILTPEDPRAVDMFSDKAVKLQGRPYLYGLIRNQNGQIINSADMATAFAQYLVKQGKKKRKTHQHKRSKTIWYVQFRMINNHQNKRAQRYRQSVHHYATRYHISKSLIYAIMQIESNFNPYAVSHAPAYGLMQIVPHSGGRDAYRHIHQRDKIPGKQYLFKTKNNIEMGAAYLHILHYNYLSAIKNPVSREYCTIAAYNTGAGNVLRVFSKNKTAAIRAINKLSARATYKRLRNHLPYAETRDYLHKVIKARPKYTGF